MIKAFIAKMKKVQLIISLLLLILSFFFFRYYLSHGDVSKAEIFYGNSTICTEKELEAAVNLVREDFRQCFGACTLRSIKYGGDNDRNVRVTKKYKQIALYIIFDTNKFGGRGGLENNKTYDGFSYTLRSYNNEDWEIVTEGYA